MPCSFSVEGRRIGSKPSTMTGQGLFCYISAWSPADSNGRGHPRKSVPLPGRNIGGSWKDYPSNSQRRSGLPKERKITDFLCKTEKNIFLFSRFSQSRKPFAFLFPAVSTMPSQVGSFPVDNRRSEREISRIFLPQKSYPPLK